MIADAHRTRFVYQDENGAPVGCVDRLDMPSGGKRFIQYRFDADEFRSGLAGRTLPLISLPDVRRRIESNQRVFLFEGERKTERFAAEIERAGTAAAATTIAGGANASLAAEHIRQLRGAADIVIVVDSDRPGRAAGKARASLIAREMPEAQVRLLDIFPDRDDGSDIEDFFDEGGRTDDLARRISAAPRVVASESSAVARSEPPRSEFEWSDSRPWPTLEDSALYGIAGDFVRLVAPQSEADPAALLVQALAAFGCAIGPGGHALVEATRHPGKLNVLLVGETAGGRKGTSLDQVRRLFRLANPEWLDAAGISGLTSGEGLIARLRDGSGGAFSEKRVLVTEPEFARTLAAASRKGSTLSAVIRDAWDGDKLQILTRTDPLVAHGCHVTILGHITADELRAMLTTTDIASGLFNRFLAICVRRSQRLPNGGRLSDADLKPLVKRLEAAIQFGRSADCIGRSDAANEAWATFYNGVPEPTGLLGAATARAEAQVLRLSVLFALLDCSDVIEIEHQLAAEAVWRYAAASAEHIFGETLGDEIADRILEAIRLEYPGECTREQLRGLFSRHVSSTRITAAIEYLVRRRLATKHRKSTAGRPSEIVRAVQTPRIAHSEERTRESREEL